FDPAPHPRLPTAPVLRALEEPQYDGHRLEPSRVPGDFSEADPIVRNLRLARETGPAYGGRPVGAVATGHPAIRPDRRHQSPCCALGGAEQTRVAEHPSPFYQSPDRVGQRVQKRAVRVRTAGGGQPPVRGVARGGG